MRSRKYVLQFLCLDLHVELQRRLGAWETHFILAKLSVTRVVLSNRLSSCANAILASDLVTC